MKNKYKDIMGENMKKLKLLLIMALGCIGLVGCSSSKLSEVFNEEKLKTTSQEIIQMLYNEEYDKIEEQMSQELKDAGATQQIKDAWSTVSGKLGAFDSYEKEAVVGKENNATVVTISKFENGKIQFTISYNEDMKLIGFYIK